MPNVATVLKTEISRVARKEARTATEALKKTASGHRSDIAALRRRIDALEKQLRQLSKAAAKDKPPKLTVADSSADGAANAVQRFSAKGVASHRQRLGLTAAELARLLGASTQTIYNWEQGLSRPSAKHAGAIAALRTVSKQEVAAQLAALG